MTALIDSKPVTYDDTYVLQWDKMEEELNLMDIDPRIKERVQLEFRQKKSEILVLVHSLRDRAVSCEEWVKVTSGLTRHLSRILVSAEKSQRVFERQQALLKGEETFFQAMTVKSSRGHFESAIMEAAFADVMPKQEIKTIKQAHKVATYFIPNLKNSAFSRACTFLGSEDIMDGLVTQAVSECLGFVELSCGAALEVPLAVPLAASMLLGTGAKHVLPRFKEITVFTPDQHEAWKLASAYEGPTLASSASTVELILHASERLGAAVETTLKNVASTVKEVARIYCDYFGFTEEKRAHFNKQCEEYLYHLREEMKLY